MATYTVTLSHSYKGLATYHASSISYDTYSYWSPSSISVPTWNSGRKTFGGYSCVSQATGDVYVVSKSGKCQNWVGGPQTASEHWDLLVPGAIVKDGSSYVGDIAYDNGTWYSDYATRTPLNALHPIQIPRKELYRFIGCYSTNGTTGTKYINADGTPTDAFLSLAPTKDITIYAQFELVSVKITISSTYGDYQFKTFYQAKTADGSGKFGYFTDSSCTPESRIYGIPVPTRELYAWNGLRSSSSTSGTLYANADGTFTDAFLNRSATATTAYGSFWTQVSYKVTVKPNGGSADILAYYTDKTNGGIFSDWLCETPEIDELPIPLRTSYRFLGYFSSTSGGTQYSDFTGYVEDALKTRKATTTIYARWRSASNTITLNPNGGTGGGTIYFDGTDSMYFNGSSETIFEVEVPEYTGNVFLGYFDAQTGGNLVIDVHGIIDPEYRPSGNVTLYAQWSIGKSIIEIDAGEGVAATERFYYDHAARKFYADEDLTEEITSVALPTLRLFNTNGLFTESVGGETVVSASGAIQPSFVPMDEFETIYAQYTRRCFEVSIDTAGGSFAHTSIFHAPSGSTWFSDEMLTTVVTNVGVSQRTGYAFVGCFYGVNQVIGTDGSILQAAFAGEDYTATADWTAKTYTLTFSAHPGTPSFDSKTVTFDALIGTLPTATLKGRRLDGWSIEGVNISATDYWTFDSNKTANANWHDGFGGVTDYFGLDTGNGPLMLVASNSGAARTVIETSHAGRIDTANAFGRLLNPVCTYRIRKEGRVTIGLGAAWRGSGTNTSGYMLTSAEYATAADGEPILVVRGVANEGANAINRWSVALDVNPDHIAQDPMGAVSGGGELTECKTLVTCDPVVPYENGMPCASDIVHGKIVVTATTNAYGDENAPTARSGFLETNGVPQGETDVDFISYAFQAERSF